MATTLTSPDCIDIITPFAEALGENPQLPEVQMMGGVGSAALKHPETIILPDEKRIVTSKTFTQANPDLSQYRSNGTLRDLDMLVLTDDEAQTQEVEALAKEIIGDQLVVSAFCLREGEHLNAQIRSPFGVKSLKTFLSDRYVMPDGSLEKALFPFAVPIDGDFTETWALEVGDTEFKVANPAATIMNYLTRSVSGLRTKDHAKVEEMATEVFAKAPELEEWAIDGPGQTHKQLADILHALRYADTPMGGRISVGGVIPLQAPDTIRGLSEIDAFMLPDASRRVQEATITLAAIKSRALGVGESNEKIVRHFQTFFEERLHSITRNS